MDRYYPLSPARTGPRAGARLIPALALALAVAAPGAAMAETSDRDALYQQALTYERGDGVARDSARALTLYCRAARAGSWKAAFNVGWMRLDAPAGWLRAAPNGGGEAAVPRLRMVPRAGAPARDRCGRKGAPGTPARMPAAPPAIVALVNELAPRFDVEPRLVLSMIAVESAFRADAVSPKSAQGLMQLIPQTARRFGVTNPFDPRQNIEGGIKYLRWLLDHFGGDKELALAGYNAGEQAVTKHGGIPPYRETRSYVKKVLGLYAQAPKSGRSGTAVASLPQAGTAAAPATPVAAPVRTPGVKPRRRAAASQACYKVGADKVVRSC